LLRVNIDVSLSQADGVIFDGTGGIFLGYLPTMKKKYGKDNI